MMGSVFRVHVHSMQRMKVNIGFQVRACISYSGRLEIEKKLQRFRVSKDEGGERGGGILVGD